MWANQCPPSRKTGTSAAGQSYRWQSLAWQTASSQWPLETVRELTDLRPAGGGEQKLENKNINAMMKRGGNRGPGWAKRIHRGGETGQKH